MVALTCSDASRRTRVGILAHFDTAFSVIDTDYPGRVLETMVTASSNEHSSSRIAYLTALSSVRADPARFPEEA